MNLTKNQHLTYCLNVHPGENWDDNFAAIKKHTLQIRDAVAPNKPFGLGLRLSNEAAITLSDPTKISELNEFLAENNLYVFTANAFPYGAFHKQRVKENVYLPDWRYNERRDYTMKVADILAATLPDGETASISTVPCSYKEWIKEDSDITAMTTRIMDTVMHLAQLEELTGRHIHLGLEPEPDCYLETTEDVLAFFAGPIQEDGESYLAFKMRISEEKAKELISRHLGICFDTCHFALQFEDLTDSIKRISDAGILISKIQISSALCTHNSDAARSELQAFCDPVYLHQVKSRNNNHAITSYNDLDNALQTSESSDDEWRIHFHVPLYFEKYGALGSTINELTPSFFETIKELEIECLEIETYTFNVLPPELQTKGIVKSVTSEYQWLLNKLL